jgi:hypothetical protein
MINLDNILTSPNVADPWEYKIVDNILPDDTYAKIVNESDKLHQFLRNSPSNQDGIWMFKAKEYGVSQEVIDIILNINGVLLKNAEKLLSQFDQKTRSKIGYFSIPRIGYCNVDTPCEIHDDGESLDKSLIMVIYLSPKKSNGTKMYLDNNADTFVKEIEWVENRAFIFCPIKDVTWHAFEGSDEPRLTLLFYYERIEDASYINNLSSEQMSWFYENFNNENVLLETKDLL